MGMPSEGILAGSTIRTRIREVPVCTLQDDIDRLKARTPAEWKMAVVIDSARIVLGLLDFTTAADREPIENAMSPAPLTLRPSVFIAEAVDFFSQSNLTFVLVTKSTGELMGAIRKIDFEDHRHD